MRLMVSPWPCGWKTARRRARMSGKWHRRRARAGGRATSGLLAQRNCVYSAPAAYATTLLVLAAAAIIALVASAWHVVMAPATL